MTSRATYLEQQRIARDRVQIERDRAEIEMRLNATPATIRKRRLPVTQELYARDAITLDQLRAANEVSEIFVQLTQGLHARTSNFSDRVLIDLQMTMTGNLVLAGDTTNSTFHGGRR